MIYTPTECSKLADVDLPPYLADSLLRVTTHPAYKIDELMHANWAKNLGVTASA